ncbi:MAG: type II toxin-antitoxin system HicB family antitoxin [Candidatus Binatia bacterium]
MRQFIYPANVERDEDGHFLVTFPDIPEAGTDGKTLEESLAEATDCLEEAVAGRIARTQEIPRASRKQKGQYAVVLPVHTAAKAALYLAMRESGTSKIELARRLGRDEKEIRHLLDPKYSSQLQDIEEALAAIGQELVVGVQTSVAGGIV